MSGLQAKSCETEAPQSARVSPGDHRRPPADAVVDAKWLEPTWVKVRRIRFGSGRPKNRLVHVTDIHHKGDSAYLRSIVKKINALSPDFVCFTGDLIEEGRFLPEALEILTA